MATAYVVRGAKMKCDKGTHKKKINLPASHGAYSNGNPIMNESDNVVGENISDFGICKGGCPSTGNITLVKKNGRTVTGKKCQVMILKEWMNAQGDTLIGGAPALTTDSTLICAYGGTIKFVTDGQA
ncbi:MULTISPECIES: DUF4280 domain-containing protein [Clostridium]|uniref:DUF4280 domain-containing protein n=1 Tax=Clostridium saccharoperbutylacetonicum N1-4(HMT) TaxID=931276 RepID=M1MRL3_9CLOT|nr:DUF4280 domain-containing protein [Clostridium saccharoperbutylacetonicum]AGF54222.1 hypothetical protein Cspa_c04040 [Clostridium saccharoperbutylacetonicum N1-4(HMT)]AQR93133.1 hypothetical protein CLSAP_04100 [Clostridium saccharoperbutylacetonicum]NRT59264.1 hypothetical protein [Clostridium saccharoperbutylacetonicum]NSB28454.1 hypothetical protein [Clostridium saccharoperbutylacetonicum]NSB34545.1 hypothetical protein [Clostridium saccharoperbutylacetonicum]